jgi:hypothetical protein
MTPAVRRAVTSACFLAAIAALLAIAAPHAVAQSAKSPAAGSWRGAFTTDGPSGTMTVSLAHEADAWKATNVVEADAAPPSGDIRELKVEGNLVSWVQTFGEYDVTFKATIEGDLMKGWIEAYQGGMMVAGGSFELKKQP